MFTFALNDRRVEGAVCVCLCVYRFKVNKLETLAGEDREKAHHGFTDPLRRVISLDETEAGEKDAEKRLRGKNGKLHASQFRRRIGKNFGS